MKILKNLTIYSHKLFLYEGIYGINRLQNKCIDRATLGKILGSAKYYYNLLKILEIVHTKLDKYEDFGNYILWLY